MWDVCHCTHRGGEAKNCDVLCVREEKDRYAAALCDGLNGTGAGERAAALCAREIVAALARQTDCVQAVREGAEKLAAQAAQERALARACTTATVFTLRGNECSFASVGDTRLYLFSGGAVRALTPDDTAAYRQYAAGELPYGALRLPEHRGALAACLGDGRAPQPHAGSVYLAGGDRLLLCTDGFWEAVTETELSADACKSETAGAWLHLALERLLQRTRLAGDNLTALALIYHGEETV